MKRDDMLHRIYHAFQLNPVVAILGPRQCGKTTLAHMYLKEQEDLPSANYFDLERPSHIQRLQNPELALTQLHGLITLDEIQRIPELFPLLRALIDDQQLDQQYLILGSASRGLLQQSSESLAGRISYIELAPFNSTETQHLNQTWLRGGFPKSYLAQSEEQSFGWRNEFIRTYLEIDIPNLGIDVDPSLLRRFWMMLTHYHGMIFNASELGRSLNLSHNTIIKYVNILNNIFMIRKLQPWFANIKKRQVKSPKIYFRDSGIFHTLLRVHNMQELWCHPKLGLSWEGFAIEEIIRALDVDAEDCYFWATHADAELDLFIIKEGKRLGFEIKFTDTPKTTKSMHIACEDLNLDELTVIHPGEHRFPLTESITACGLKHFIQEHDVLNTDFHGKK